MTNFIKFLTTYKLYIIAACIFTCITGITYFALEATRDDTKEIINIKTKLQNEMANWNGYDFKKTFEKDPAKKQQALKVLTDLEKRIEKIDCNKVQNNYYTDCNNLKTLIPGSKKQLETL